VRNRHAHLSRNDFLLRIEPGQGVDEFGEPRTEEQDKALIKRVNASLLKTQAARRRGAVQLKPYKVDDTVRLIWCDDF
jgi:hypothetical protein